MAFATKKKCEELLQYFTTMIDNRRKELKNGEQPTQSVIDVMLTSPSNFTEDEVGIHFSDPNWCFYLQLIANIVSIFLAGFETTATSLTFFMKHLGEFTEIQQKCRDEVKTVLQGRTMTAEDLRLVRIAILGNVYNIANTSYLSCRTSQQRWKNPCDTTLLSELFRPE